MSKIRAFRRACLAGVLAMATIGAVACARPPMPVAESAATTASAADKATIKIKTGTSSCGADAFPAPYQSVDPCDQYEVSCAALAALFTWNPAADGSIDAALNRAKPLIVKAGLKNADGTPLDPFAPPADVAGGHGAMNLRPKWEELRDSHKALAAYVAKESMGPNTVPFYYIIQFEYPASGIGRDGTPELGASPDGDAWEWSAITTVSGADGPGYKLSSTGKYGDRRPVMGDPDFTPSQSKRWGCQHTK